MIPGGKRLADEGPPCAGHKWCGIAFLGLHDQRGQVVVSLTSYLHQVTFKSHCLAEVAAFI